MKSIFLKCVAENNYKYWNHLRKENLSPISLNEIGLEHDLTFFNLNNISFINSEIINAKIFKGNLYDINFISCKIIGLILENSKLHRINFTKSVVSKTSFKETICTNCEFNDCTIDSAFFCNASLQQSSFHNGRILQIYFENAVINDCKIKTHVMSIWLDNSTWINTTLDICLGAIFGKARAFENLYLEKLSFDNTVHS